MTPALRLQLYFRLALLLTIAIAAAITLTPGGTP